MAAERSATCRRCFSASETKACWGGLAIAGDVGETAIAANSVSSVGNGANVRGAASQRQDAFDIGIEFGSPGIGRDDVRTAGFTLSHESLDLTLHLIPGPATTLIDGNGSVVDMALSHDGSQLVFASSATDLVSGETDQNGSTVGIFLHDLVSGETTNLTNGANGGSREPTISADGRLIAFQTDATNIVAGQSDANNKTDIILHDTDTGAMTNVTRVGDGASRFPSLSADGTNLASASLATNLPGGEPDQFNTPEDIYLHDIGTDGMVSVTDARTRIINSSDLFVGPPSISGDGSSLVFASTAHDLTPIFEITNTADVFLYEML